MIIWSSQLAYTSRIQFGSWQCGVDIPWVVFTVRVVMKIEIILDGAVKWDEAAWPEQTNADSTD